MIKSNNRTPMRIGKSFKQELIRIQAKLMISKGIRYSLSEISDMLIKTNSFKEMENELTAIDKFVLKLDKRK